MEMKNTVVFEIKGRSLKSGKVLIAKTKRLTKRASDGWDWARF